MVVASLVPPRSYRCVQAQAKLDAEARERALTAKVTPVRPSSKASARPLSPIKSPPPAPAPASAVADAPQASSSSGKAKGHGAKPRSPIRATRTGVWASTVAVWCVSVCVGAQTLSCALIVVLLTS